VRLLALVALIGAAGGCTGANPDYDPDAAAAVCTAGDRQCGPAGPQVCVRQADGSGAWSDDFCPTGGGCQDGFCAPPAGATTCVRNADCGAELCVVFVAAGGLARYCAPATGTVMSGSACQASAECMTGLCQGQSSGSALCYAACGDSTDCDNGRTCTAADVTVTGVRGAVQGCMK
jgi:hypothetical protein